MPTLSSDHPDEESLQALVTGVLADEQAESVERHLSNCLTCGQRLDELETDQGFGKKVQSALLRESLLNKEPVLRAGTQIGNYKLIRLIGEGGMGAVYLADQIEHIARKVAVKIIKSPRKSDQAIARFEAERQSLARMNHANIVSLLDAGRTTDNQLYFVMEYVEGMPITEFADRHRLSLRQRLELFASVCSAIQHAHQKGVIHRDIKPSNILVSSKHEIPLVKIIDFGIAKETDEAIRNNRTVDGQVVGTVAYMSPEQASLSAREVDTQSDVYSLGTVLYELLCGSCPLTPEQIETMPLQQLLQRITTSEWERPSQRSLRLPEDAAVLAARQTGRIQLSQMLRDELDWIVGKALDPAKGNRYATADALARDLQRYLRNEPVDACAPSPFYHLRKFASRNRALLTTAGIFILALGFSVVVSIRMAYRASAAESKALRERDLALAASKLARESRQKMVIQKRRAEKEASIAKSVRNFVENGILGQANIFQLTPTNTIPDPNLTVRAALDRAALAVDFMFPGQPLVEASIRKTIGVSYRELGVYDTAEKHLLKALELTENAGGNPMDQRLAIMNSLASLYLKLGKYAEADGYSEEGYRRWEQGTLRHLEAETAAGNRADSLIKRGKYREAEDILRALVTESDTRNTHADIVFLHNLAVLLSRQSKYREAEPFAQQAEETARRNYGSQHPLTVSTEMLNAHLLAARGQLSQANTIIGKLLEMRVASLGEAHPETLRVMSFKALLALQVGKTAAAVDLLAVIVERYTKTVGADHPDTIRALTMLSTGYHRLGQFDKAEPLKRRLVNVSKKIHGPEHPTTLTALNNLSELYRVTGRLDEAEDIKKDVLASRKRVLGPEHRQTLTAMNNLGILYYARNRFDEAERLLLEAFQLRKKTLGPNHPETLQALENLAMTHQAKGHFEKAAAAFGELSKAQADRSDVSEPVRAKSLARLGNALLRCGRPAQARHKLADAIEMMTTAAPLHWRLQEARGWLGECEIAEKHFERAESVLLDAHKRMTSAQGCPPEAIDRLRASIVQLYDNWERPEDAAKWKTER